MCEINKDTEILCKDEMSGTEYGIGGDGALFLRNQRWGRGTEMPDTPENRLKMERAFMRNSRRGLAHGRNWKQRVFNVGDLDIDRNYRIEPLTEQELDDRNRLIKLAEVKIAFYAGLVSSKIKLSRQMKQEYYWYQYQLLRIKNQIKASEGREKFMVSDRFFMETADEINRKVHWAAGIVFAVIIIIIILRI